MYFKGESSSLLSVHVISVCNYTSNWEGILILSYALSDQEQEIALLKAVSLLLENFLGQLLVSVMVNPS